MIIVTGGAGFIGSAVVAKLNSEGIHDIVVVDEFADSDSWRNLVTRRYYEYRHKDEFLPELIDNLLPYHNDITAIIHMGACSSTTETDMDYLHRNNTVYTQTLIHWAAEHDVRMIYASSAATYGEGEQGFSDDHDGIHALRPINRYAYSKQLVDVWALDHGYSEKSVGLKFFNVFGPNEYHKGSMKSLVCKAYSQISDTGELKLFKSHRPDYEHGEQKRDFVYVKDCANVIWWLLNNGKTGIFNVGYGEAKSWNELANATFSAMGRDSNISYIDMPESIRNQYQYYTEAPIQKLQNAGYDIPFTPLDEAVKDYVQNYLSENFRVL